jgi:phosphatidylserine/phosphatidylglycerophosphate/cardiolipin synthase-like enzyme
MARLMENRPMKKLIIPVLAAAFLMPAVGKKSHGSTADTAASITVPAAGQVEVAFSPNEGSERLVIKVIDSAQHELRVMAYSFTSVPIVEALLHAKHRGVDVRLVVDDKDSHQPKARAALGALATAGVEVRTVSAYPIHHDKVIIVDRQTVELGSFNFSDAAAHKNSENVLVAWGNPRLADVYLAHFDRNYRQGAAFAPGF